MKKIFTSAVLGILTFMPCCYAMMQTVQTNADTNSGVTTSMNGNTHTDAGVPISSTSSSSESRSVSGSGD